MKLSFEKFENSKFKMDKSSIGKILGGQAVITSGGSRTVGAGTQYETTYTYSSDSSENGATTYHTTTASDPVA